MKSSSSTAPPTARRSRSSTPNATPSTSKRLRARLGRAARRSGTVRDPDLPGDRRGALRALLGARLRRHHLQPARRPRSPRRAAAQSRSQRLGLRRHGPPARGHAQRGRSAQHPAGRRPEPGAARAAARRRALGAAPRPRPAAAPAPALGGADPERAPNAPRDGRLRAIDEALFVATSCEETPFPWQRAAPPTTRLAEADAFLRALPGADFYPFDATTALGNSLVPALRRMARRLRGAPAAGALPDVPTLILSGAQDLRTPTSNARAVAALIPDAQLEVVPFTGHSVLGSDFSGCADRRVTAFFAGAPVAAVRVDHRPVRADADRADEARLRARALRARRQAPGRR